MARDTKQEEIWNKLITMTDFRITSADTDMEARLRPGALFNYLAHSAYLSADHLGFGYQHLKKQNLFWVLNRLEMHILRPLKWNETVTVETWPKEIDGLLFLRDFLVRDQRGETVVKAGSAWLAIDSESKRPRRKESLDSDVFERLKEKQALSKPPEKLQDMTEGEPFHVQSTYFDIDLNRHVTSSRYIDWMIDTFDSGFHHLHYPKLIAVNFLKETMPGNQIGIRRMEIHENTFLFQGVHTESGRASFRGKIMF